MHAQPWKNEPMLQQHYYKYVYRIKKEKETKKYIQQRK